MSPYKFNSLQKVIITMILCILTTGNGLNAQGLANWYFGQKAGIYFNSSSVVTFINGSQMSTPEGCAVYESSPINAEFYSNGEKVWNAQTGNIINNGNNLDGSMNSCQSALFYETTLSDTIYLFTTDAHNGNKGLSYNIFQNQNGNLSLVSKNNSLLATSTERMTLTNHCNEKSMWLISHQWNSDAFYCYLINENFLDTTPYISHIGSVHNGNSLNAKGCLKVSHDGTTIALAKMKAGTVELFHFDNIQGTVSDPIILTGIPNAYGIEFSPTDNILYVSSVTGQIVQFNLNNWNQTAILNTKFIVSSQAQLLGSLQMGPDQMIYVAQDNNYYLGRIELPNNMGLSCIYNATAVYLNGHKGEAGLPQTYIKKTGFDIQVPVVCLGDTSFFKILGDSTRLDSVKWYFGTQPILDSSFLFSPFYIFNSLGNYNVKLFIYHCDTVDSLESITKVVGPPSANLGPDTSFCNNDVKALYAGGGTDYLWDDSSTNATRPINSPGIYWVKVSNSCGDDYDSIEVLNIFANPIASLPPDSTICFGDSVVLDAGNDSLINIWQGSDTSRFYTASQEGLYQLFITDSNKCTAADAFSLSVDNIPFIDLGPDTTICIGFTLLFNGSSQGNYLWQDGSTDTSLLVDKEGTYYAIVQNACGIVSDSCTVRYEDCKQIIWVPNAFTPNNDGVNDLFLPYVENVETYRLYIYNRWGQLIFNTTDINEGWNGYYKNMKAPQDSYTWRIDYTNFKGQDFTKYGFIILYR